MKTKVFSGSRGRVLFCLFLAVALLCGALAVGGSAAPTLTGEQPRVAIDGSRTHTAVLSGGNLYLAGYNDAGQLPTIKSRYLSAPRKLLTNVEAVAVAPGRTLVVSGGKLTAYGLDSVTASPYENPKVLAYSGVSSVEAYEGNSAYISTEGALYVWGSNASGQLGTGSISPVSLPQKLVDSGVTSVAMGGTFMMYVTSDNKLYGCGSNLFQQLGQPEDTTSLLTPTLLMENVEAVSAGQAHACVLTTDGSLYTSGSNDLGQLGEATNSSAGFQKILSGITAVSSGSNHNFAVANSGVVYAWGDNKDGQLGNSDSVFVGTPMEASLPCTVFYPTENSTLAVDSQDNIYAWGNNDGYLLLTGDSVSLSAPVQVYDSEMNWLFADKNGGDNEDGENGEGGGSSEPDVPTLPLPAQTGSAFMDGYGNGAMRPDRNITRAEFVKMLVTGLGLYDESVKYTAPSFIDIPTSKWYVPYIACAEQLKLVNGYDDGSFHPESQITRAEAAKITAVALELDVDAIPSKTFTDVTGWAKPYVDALASVGILGGYDDGTFRPGRNITRAEAAKMIALSRKFAFTDEQLSTVTTQCANPFTDVDTDKWYYPYMLHAAGYALEPAADAE